MKQKSKHDAHAHERLLNEGDTVLVRNYLRGEKWEPGTIIKKTGPVSYSVKLSDGRDRRCHQDQVRKRFAGVNTPEKEVEVDIPTPPPDPVPDSPDNRDSGKSDSPEVPRQTETRTLIVPKTYPRRDRKQVQRYEPQW